MIKLMGKKIFTIVSQKFNLSKPMHAGYLLQFSSKINIGIITLKAMLEPQSCIIHL